MRDSSAQGLIAWKERLTLLSISGDAAILLLYSAALCVIAGVERYLGGASLDGLVDFNAGEILALYAIYSVVTAKTALITLSRADLAVIAACALLMLPPVSQHFAFFGAGVAGLYLVLRHPRKAPLSQVGWLWLAISFYESFSQLLFKFISATWIQGEVHFAAWIGPLLGFPITRDGIRLVSPDGWFIYILESCSAFSNISLAILLWLSLLTLAGAEIHRRQLVALGVAAVSIFLLNALRILLMTPSQPAWYFWHEGTGALIFSAVTFLAVALPTALSLRSRA